MALILSLLLHGAAVGALVVAGGRIPASSRVELLDFDLLASAAPAVTAPPEVEAPAVCKAPSPAVKVAEHRPVKPPPEPEAVPLPVEDLLEEIPEVAAEEIPVAEAETEPVLQEVVAGESGNGTPVVAPAESGGTVQSPPGTARERYLSEHFAYIRERVLRRLCYPVVARRNGWGGETRVAFLILADGAIDALRIERSSGKSLLDRQALEAVRKAAPFPPPPVVAELVLPVTFELR